MNSSQKYILKLYIAGSNPSSVRTLKNLRNILEEHFSRAYDLRVIDVQKNPQLAEEDRVLATPTLAKVLPPPVRKVVGDLSNRDKVLVSLELLCQNIEEVEN